MSFYVSTATFVLLHCDEWDRVVALSRHKFVTGATLLQLMLTSLEWQTLEQRRRISRLVMMYKIQHQFVDIDRDIYLRPGDSRTRGQHRFFQERSNYDTLRNSFQRTAREWNHLPDTTVGASSKEEFRANLQQQVSHANQCKQF